MGRKFFFTDTVPASAPITSRLGVQNAPYKDTEIGKLVKNTTESGHVLCAAGDQIGGQVVAIDNATADGYGLGSVQRKDRIRVTFDGSQAAGTGDIALFDQVVCGTVVAKDTALTTHPKVRKATIQVGTTAAADLTAAVAHMALLASGNIWKVISLGTAGTGAVGTEGVIERATDL